MKIGLFFGSFNPIHIGHLIIANYIANYKVEKVWFVVSPQNPLKQNLIPLNAETRLNLVKLAIENDERFETSDIEFHLSKPSYTIHTLKALTETYPQEEFFLIIGSDNFLTISKWKSSNEILNGYKILIYERPKFAINQNITCNNNIEYLEAPLLDISSTSIREMISKNQSVRYLVPKKVYQEICTNDYFKY